MHCSSISYHNISNTTEYDIDLYLKTCFLIYTLKLNSKRIKMIFKTAKDIDLALEYLKTKDKKMAKLIESFPKPKLRRNKNYFRVLTQAIIFQQLNGKAAQTILDRFIALYPKVSFPKPEQVLKSTTNKLRKAGLSERKASYIKDLARAFNEKEIQPRKISSMTDDEIREKLIQVKGIGNWTVDMFLMFTLNRTDILPVGDYGIKKGFQLLYKLDSLPDESFMEKKAKKWIPYRTLASRYIWQVADNNMLSKKK